MRDLVTIFQDGYKTGLSDKEINVLLAKELFQGLKQMSEEEFISCFTSASINVKTLEFEVLLRLTPATN